MTIPPFRGASSGSRGGSAEGGARFRALLMDGSPAPARRGAGGRSAYLRHDMKTARRSATTSCTTSSARCSSPATRRSRPRSPGRSSRCGRRDRPRRAGRARPARRRRDARALAAPYLARW
jgi:hypothetical protein